MSCTLSRCSLGADLYMSNSSFISFWLSWAFLGKGTGGSLVRCAESSVTGEETAIGPHLSSARRPLSSSDSFFLASSTLAFSRSALERAEATGGGPRPGPSLSRSSRLGLASGSRPREGTPWVPVAWAWASSSEETSSSFFTEAAAGMVPGTEAVSFLLSGVPPGPGPPSSFPGARALRPESSGWLRLGMQWEEPLAWARSCKDSEKSEFVSQ